MKSSLLPTISSHFYQRKELTVLFTNENICCGVRIGTTYIIDLALNLNFVFPGHFFYVYTGRKREKFFRYG